MYTVYILITSRNTFYIGQTNDLTKRLSEHQKKNSRSAKYMRTVESFRLVYSENYETRSEALKREYQLKQLTRKEKEALVASTNFIKP